MSSTLPMPPQALVQRVGRIDEPDVEAAYDAIGRESRSRIERLLPTGWSWEGKRVLDFGCGAGRTLRHFLEEAVRAEFHGCDIDAPSVAWLTDNLSPPLLVFENGELPPLPRPDAFFDLVYALSVFTHITDHWADWLLEFQRVLKPNGLLIATFLNQGHWPEYGHGPWDENRVGMNVTKKWNPWDSGGPIVFHSEWWIREHWGRAFEIVFLERSNPADSRGQGATLMRRRAARPTSEDLQRPSRDVRELAAAQNNAQQLEAEAGELFSQLHEASSSQAGLRQTAEYLRAEIESLRAELSAIAQSRSWRLTAPLRRLTAILGRRRN